MPTKIVVNCETGIAEEVELTADEIAQAEADRVAWEAEQAKQQAELAKKEAAAAAGRAKLAKLGLTDAEIDALLP